MNTFLALDLTTLPWWPVQTTGTVVGVDAPAFSADDVKGSNEYAKNLEMPPPF